MKRFTLGLAALAISFTPATAEEAYVDAAKAYLNANIASVVSAADVMDAIKQANAAHASLDQGAIDGMDKAWRAEVEGGGSGPTIDPVLGSALSKKLADFRAASGGVVTEIFIMDNKGLNVAQSDVTSDYWQGDEDKFSKSFGAGAGAIFVDEVEKDESTQALQTQASMAITGDGGEVIGAVTVGLNVDKL